MEIMRQDAINDDPALPARGTWQPLLTGEQAHRARDAVQTITDQLLVSPPAAVNQPGAASGYLSLGNGRLGTAILLASLARDSSDIPWRDGDYLESANQIIETAASRLAQVTVLPSLFGGFTGVAWAVSFCQIAAANDDGEDPCAAIDEALLDYRDRSSPADHFDLITGLVGYGVYALQRLPRAGARHCLERVIDRLDELAERRQAGITWRTGPAFLLPEQRTQWPDGYYDLGVAHGIPGVIGLLGQACAAGVARSTATVLLDGAVSWLLDQQLPPGQGGRFPYNCIPGSESPPARMGWCYGDPGVAALLLLTGRAMDNPHWQEAARELARAAAAIPPEESGVVDAGLCHGAAGLAHIYNRMFQATGEQFLRQAACFWFERTLDLRRPGEGIGGYSAWMPRPDGNKGWVADPGLLTGAAGVALALLGAITPAEPSWDGVLLLGAARA